MTQARVELLADSRQVRRATDDLKGLEQRGKTTTTVTSQLRNAFVALGGALAVRELARLSDTYTGIQNRLRIVTDSTTQLAEVQAKLLQVANDSRAEFETTVGLYSTLARSTEELGLSQDRLLRVTETINKAFAASGADATTAAGAIRQLGQGLASGALRGDEFNSVAEGAPEIMRAIAAETGMTIGALREFAAEGKITSELLITALENYGDTVDEIFRNSERTIAQSFQEARNNAIQFVGGIEAVDDASQAFGDSIVALSENLDLVVDAATALTVLYSARMVGAIGSAAAAKAADTATTIRQTQATAAAAAAELNYLQTVQRSLVAQLQSSTVTAQQIRLRQQLAANTVALAAAQRTANTAMTAGAIAARGASAALALVGGPIGVAVLAAAGLLAFAQRSETAEDRAKRLAGEVDNLAGSLEGLSRAEIIEREQAALQNVFETQQRINELVERRANAELNIADPSRVTSDQREYNQVIGNNRAAIERYNLEIEALRKKQEEERDVVNEVTEARKALIAQLEENKRKAEELNNAQDVKKLQEITQALDDQIYALENGEIAYEVMRAAREANIALDSPEADGIRARISERERLTQAIKDETQAERERQQLREGVTDIVNTLSVGDDPAAQAEDRYFERLSIIDNSIAAEGKILDEHRTAMILAEQAYQDELTKINNEEAKARAEAQKQANEMARQSQQATLSATENLFGNLAEIAKQGGEESFGAYKALASAQAGISAALAILQVYGDPTIPTFLKFPLSATIGAITAAQIAQINSQQYTGARALGGQVQAGGQYLVGERGPELITMGSNGNVTPYNQLMREARTTNNSNNMTANITFTMPEGDADFRNRIADNRDLIYNVVADVLNDRGQRF